MTIEEMHEAMEAQRLLIGRRSFTFRLWHGDGEDEYTVSLPILQARAFMWMLSAYDQAPPEDDQLSTAGPNGYVHDSDDDFFVNWFKFSDGHEIYKIHIFYKRHSSRWLYKTVPDELAVTSYIFDGAGQLVKQ